MKTKNFTKRLQSVTAACLTLVIFAASSMVALAGTENKSLMGEITVSGDRINGAAPSVMLNGASAFSGRTFFSNGTIVTPSNVTSTINLGRAGYVTMNPNTMLNLSFDETTISGTVFAGDVKIFNAEGVNVNVKNAANENIPSTSMNKSRQTDDDQKGGSATAPVLVLAGIITAVVVYIVVRNNDNEGVVSPVR